MAKNSSLNLRVSAEFKRNLTREARRANRSVTNYVETVLNQIWSAAGVLENNPQNCPQGPSQVQPGCTRSGSSERRPFARHSK